MQLLAGFFLDEFLIGLQSLNPLGVKIVFFLLLRDPGLQRLILHPLLFVDHHAIGAEHRMHEEHAGQYRNCDSRNAPPQAIDPPAQRTHNFHPGRGHRLGLWNAFRHGAHSGSRRWKSPDVCQILRPKIHSLPALADETPAPSERLLAPSVKQKLPCGLIRNQLGYKAIGPFRRSTIAVQDATLLFVGCTAESRPGARFHMTDKRIVLTTAGSEEEARKIATRLVERRLAACVNILPQMTSIYSWQGKVEESSEYLLVVKTIAAAFAEVSHVIKELHSYELPECICLAIEDGSEPYLEWIAESVSAEIFRSDRWEEL
jgi:periplasmic divalent cation tolerance protein